ncbi:MAG TPA: capsule assembly Wzi family protein [Candidatus Sulfotelmatobacter sp.]|nr:capsule assembly Wzi family protein [Candidatus Sulfotelmatobacter sp.]
MILPDGPLSRFGSTRERNQIVYVTPIEWSSRAFARIAISSKLLLFLLSFVVCTTVVHAQSIPDTPSPDKELSPKNSQSQIELVSPPVDIKSLPKNLLLDQKDFWTAPLHFSQQQWEWTVPSLLVGGLFIKADNTIEKHVPTTKSTVSHAVTASNAGVAALTAAGAGLFLLGHIQGDDQKRETGILAGEAAIGALADAEIFKYAAGRERPFTGSGTGRFFVGGDSFPSVHSSVSWAIASVIAHEYPGWLTQTLAYGTATGVSAARWAGQKHFASDVIIGAALGWYMGRQVYHAHSHYSEADVARYGTFHKSDEEQGLDPTRFMGSSYVPLDSWVYPALERMAALGYIQSESLSIRPWTRLECTRLLAEAATRIADGNTSSEVEQLYSALSAEFGYESELINGERNLNAQFESGYARFTGISGTPLTDNYHFGQTLLNDYGRPYQEGFNAVDGASGYATAGPLVLYVRGEYQYAPSASAPTQAVLNFFNASDRWPTGPALPVNSISRFRLLDTYLGLNLGNWQFSFGRNSLWWGPSEGGNMIFSDNAAPLNNMFTVDRVSPFRLPWIFRYLGDIRFEGFIGHMTGLQFQTTIYSGTNTLALFGQYGKNLHPQPFLSGGKISVQLTPNFEFGMAKTTVYGGPGNPLTVTTFLDSNFGVHYHGDVLGDGRTSADISYRIPGLRNWLTFYAETLSEDEPSPIPYMRRNASQGGLYLAKFPGISKLDVRVEGGYTNPIAFCGDCIYTNAQYNSGYNNNGRLIGTWIGRSAQGEQIQTNYWLRPKQRIGVEVRHRILDPTYVPRGGSQNDVAVNADIFAGNGFRFTGNVQYERWRIPLLAVTPQSDVAVSFQFSFWPTPHKH